MPFCHQLTHYGNSDDTQKNEAILRLLSVAGPRADGTPSEGRAQYGGEAVEPDIGSTYRQVLRVETCTTTIKRLELLGIGRKREEIQSRCVAIAWPPSRRLTSVAGQETRGCVCA